MVFYLKYRPKTIAELDDPEIATAMSKYLSRASLPHAFLFTGPKGIGKTSTARIVAKSINCTKGGTRGIACGVCETCISIGRGDNLDVLEIDAASNRGIDEIRSLREKIKLTPTSLAYKVYIIDEVHMLTTEAFNALLKTLEEPPSHAVFILATTEAHKIPATIISRCIEVEFGRATDEALVHSLSRIVKGEKLDVEPGVLEFIARAADGAFRDAAKMLEEVASGEKITLAALKSHLGTVDALIISEFFKQLKEKRAKELLALVGILVQEGKNVKQFFLEILKNLEQKLLSHFTAKSDWTKAELVTAIKLFSQAFVETKTTMIPSLPFELAIVEYCEGANILVQEPKKPAVVTQANDAPRSVSASVEPLASRWNEFLELLKPLNHSIAGVMRSCRPFSLDNNVLVIEALYKFHAERLGEPKSHDIIVQVIKEMLGLDIKVEVVLKKRN